MQGMRRTGTIAALLTLLFAGSAVAALYSKELPRVSVVRPDDANLRFIGHWDESRASEQAVTVNTGSRILCGFTGHSVHALFGTEGITSPAGIYVSIDGGAPSFYRVDRNEIGFTPTALRGARHRLEIDVKDIDEAPNRWIPPLNSALSFKGLVLDRGAKTLPVAAPGGIKMEFYGDSITQGNALLFSSLRPEASDGTKDYAFLTALAFGAIHNQIGFGRQGVIRDGAGNVPPAPASFGWNYQGSPADPDFIPGVVIVNQGSNDVAFPAERFEPVYRDYIRQIRGAYPQAWILCLRPFGGYHEADVKSAAESLADVRVVYVDTTGWLRASDYTDGVHPTAQGHARAAEKLTEVVTRCTGFQPVPRR